jgi:hypothetical protein
MAITMRELQKMSAKKIRALTRPTPIKSGGETVAMLIPRGDNRAARFRDLAEQSAALRASLTAEERERIAHHLGEDLD